MASSVPNSLQLDPADEVVVAVSMLQPGQVVTHRGEDFRVAQSILPGHKMAIRSREVGEPIRKFGQIIGFATAPISVGEHVHSHNLACGSYERDYAICEEVPAPLPDEPSRTFAGYLRPDGRVGTRNYLALISTVNCSASTVHRIAQHFSPERLADFPNVDGVIAITHKTGCGMASSGNDRDNLSRTLRGFANHPNVFGYVVVGLGCEVNQAEQLISAASLGAIDKAPRILTVQSAGGVHATVEQGIQAVAQMLPMANLACRSDQLVSKLILGTNCGGSDGNSGVTANPALGFASDRVVAQKGSVILGETTEIYGAEHLLTRRAVRREVAEKLLERIRWWEWYTSILGAKIDNNPSFGNKQGGLTTIFEKSLGAVAKGGSTALVDVVEFAEQVRRPGLTVMDTPGFDPVSVTGIVAGGANVMVFTTGRGSVLGCKPTPTIKVATNTPLYEHMQSDMDFDAGVVLAGLPVEEVGRALFEKILAVASGEKTKSEQQGLGDDEFAPWTVGPVL
ncbi:altronate dehydratase family protein [bacterium]|nr:altronate dehydratase family protein [bacterium]